MRSGKHKLYELEGIRYCSRFFLFVLSVKFARSKNVKLFYSLYSVFLLAVEALYGI